MQYDKEEKDILDAYEEGKIELSTPSKKEIEAIKATARKTLVKDKRITIRLYEHDYQGIQKKAMEMGIPYQTLISGVIHRYIEGELTSKQDNHRVQPIGGKKRRASG
jgi:predicted DNA binding CopG/RHH family protein